MDAQPVETTASGQHRMRTALLLLVVLFLPVLFYNYSLTFPFFCDSNFIYAQVAGTSYQTEASKARYGACHNVYNIIDPEVAREHPHLLPWWASPDMKMLYFRPVSSLSLKLDYLIWGKNPLGFRLSNLLLHGLCCVFLFLIGRALKLRDRVLFLAVLIFTSHFSSVILLPWVIDRVTPLSMLFGLTGLYLHIRFRKTGARPFEVAAWISFILAFLSRESGVMCIFSYFLYDYFIWRKDRPRDWPGIIRSGLYYTVLCIPFFLFMLYFIKTGFGVKGFYSAFGEGRTPAATVVYILKNIFLYVESLLFFSLIANENNTLLFRQAGYLIPFLVMLALAALLLYPGVKKRIFRDRFYLFLFSWMFFAVLPNLYLIPQNRYLYPALAPFALFMAHYLFEIKGAKLFRRFSSVVFYTLLIFYGFLFVILLNLGRSKLAENYHGQERLARETFAFLKDAAPPVNAFYINVTDPLATFALQFAFDNELGRDRIRTFPLTISKEVPDVEVIGDRSLRITAKSEPFLNNQFERMFMTESPNREGYSRSNKYFTATVEKVEGGKIRAIRFDFTSRLDSDTVNLFYWENDRLHRFTPPALKEQTARTPGS